MTEKLGFEELVRQGRPIDGAQPLMPARAKAMKGARDEFFASTAFTFYQHREGRGGGARNGLSHRLHQWTVADDFGNQIPNPCGRRECIKAGAQRRSRQRGKRLQCLVKVRALPRLALGN